MVLTLVLDLQPAPFAISEKLMLFEVLRDE